MPYLDQHKDGLRLRVRVIPRAPTTKIDGIHDDAIKIRLHAPPEDGKANKELIRFLSKILKLPQRSIQISSGQKNGRKRFCYGTLTSQFLRRSSARS